MRWLYSSLLAVLLLCIPVSLLGSSVGLGTTYSAITKTGSGTYNVPLAECADSVVLRIYQSGAYVLDLDSTAPIGTVCNIMVASTGYDVTVQSTAGAFFNQSGSGVASVLCDYDGTHSTNGCFASFVKNASATWTCNGTPFGNWVW